MGRMASVRKKFREAFFFYSHLSDGKTVVEPEREDVDFYLSAFLSAGKSIIGFFHEGENRAWFNCWKIGLVEDDRKLLNDMVHQRNLEVHEGGADVIPEFEVVPVNTNDTGPSCEKLGSATLPIPALPVRRKGYYFWIDGKRLDVNSVSRRYLELLLKLVSDYDESLTISE
jgi:hypothetical protein